MNDVEQCLLSSSRSQEIGNEFESKGSISGLAQFHQALGFAPLVDVRPPLCKFFRRRATCHSEKSECFVKVLDRWRCIQKYGATSCRYFPTFPADLVGTVLLILLLLASCRSPLENCEKTVEKREFLTCFALFCPFLSVSLSVCGVSTLKPLGDSLAILYLLYCSRGSGQKRRRMLESVTVFERESSATDLALTLSETQKLDVGVISSRSKLRTYLFDDGAHRRGRAHWRLESRRTRLTFSRASTLSVYYSSSQSPSGGIV